MNARLDIIEPVHVGYLTCARWVQSTERDGLDLTVEPALHNKTRSAVEKFVSQNFGDVVDYISRRRGSVEASHDGQTAVEAAAEHFGHDLYLTRNSHGAGFWDRGMGDLGLRLTEAAEQLGADDIMLSEDALSLC